MDEEVHLTVSDDSWKLYPCSAHHNLQTAGWAAVCYPQQLLTDYIHYIRESCVTSTLDFESIVYFQASHSFLSGHVFIKRK